MSFGPFLRGSFTGGVPLHRLKKLLRIDVNDGDILELLCTVKVSQDESVCRILFAQVVAQCLFAHHLESLQVVLKEVRNSLNITTADMNTV